MNKVLAGLRNYWPAHIHDSIDGISAMDAVDLNLLEMGEENEDDMAQQKHIVQVK